jgi:hypothetical protein
VQEDRLPLPLALKNRNQQRLFISTPNTHPHPQTFLAAAKEESTFSEHISGPPVGKPTAASSSKPKFTIQKWCVCVLGVGGGGS